MKNLIIALFILSLAACTSKNYPEPESVPCIDISADTIPIADSLRIVNCNDFPLQLQDDYAMSVTEIPARDTFFIQYQWEGAYGYTYYKLPRTGTTRFTTFKIVVE